MPIAKVQLSDGRIAKFEVPEGTSEQAILAEAKKLEANTLQERVKPQENFIERTGQALGQRAQNIGESWRGNESIMGFNGQGVPEALFQTGGQAIGATGDVLGNLAISGYRALPEPVKGGIGALGRGFMNLPSVGGGTLGETIPQELGMLSDQWGQFEETNPRAARNLAALGNVASVMPFGKTTKAAAKTLEKGSDALKQQASILTKNFKNMTADQIKQQSVKLYDDAARLGGKLKPQFIDDVMKKTKSEISAPTSAGRKFAAKTKDVNYQKEVDNLFDAFNSIKDEDITLQAFDDIDKQITKKLQESKFRTDTGSLNAAGQDIKTLQENARDAVLNATDDVVEGGTEGFEALKAARDAYRTQIKMREIEDILEVSATYQQPSTAIKRRLANLATGKQGKMLYTPDERKALLKASETGAVTELLNAFGSRLSSPVAIGSGNPALGAGLRAASALPRGSAEALQAQKAQAVIDMIGRGGAEITTPQRLQALGAMGLNAGAVPLDAASLMLKYRTPQLTTLGTLNQAQEQ